MIEIEREGFEIGNRGLSATVHAPYRNHNFHNAWMRGWYRGYDAYLSAHKTCISCGARVESADQLVCGH